MKRKIRSKSSLIKQKGQAKQSSNGANAKRQTEQNSPNVTMAKMQNGGKPASSDDILALQQALGNRAVSQMLNNGQQSVARKPKNGSKSSGKADKAALDDKAKSIKEKLSYGMFDWAVTDKEAREAIGELSSMSDGALKSILGKIGTKYTRRLLNNLSGADRKKHAPTVVRIIRLRGAKNAVSYIKQLLSYGLFDWAVTDADASRVVEVFDAYPTAGFLRLIKKIGKSYWYRLLVNLPAKAKKLVDRYVKALKTLSPEKLSADKKIIGSAQATRAIAKYKALEAVDQVKFQEILAKAGSENEQRYLYKALAASYSLGEIATFAGKIRGKGDKWMGNNLRLTEDSKGGGIKQQWSHTCNITTVMAVQGQMDPIYALKMHEENPDLGKVDEADATKMNPKMAADQKAGLEDPYSGKKFGAHSGTASPRAAAAGGSGRWADDKLNAISEKTGVKYTTKLVGTDITLAAAVTAIEEGVKQGMPVPIVIGNGPKAYTHYVLVTRKSKAKPPTFKIHDPWEGKTYSRTKKRILAGKINIAGSNQITAIEQANSK